MHAFWDRNYSVPGHKYGTAPNAFLVDQAHRIPAGSEVLVPGDGEGRNSVWLAQQGHRVTAMDASAVGLHKARVLATDQGVDVQTVLGDLADWVPEPGRFGAVVLIYVHLPEAIRRSAHRRLAAALRPGGCWLLESFHPGQLLHTSGGPKDVSMLHTPAVLADDFAGLLAQDWAWDGETLLAEGSGHQGLAHVTRWIGHMPG
jgi:2-polyprenyl-3-methyl-5-hydroxy-6-metoxy-1,4-benzoquinol methylase